MRRRRDLLVLLAGSAVFLRGGAAAQQSALPVIGVIATTGTTAGDIRPDFLQGLSEAGFIAGKNVVIDFRSAEGHYDRLPSIAAELVNRQVSLIFAGTLVAAVAAKAATKTIPIVFWSGGDPVEPGLVASLNRPGGNLTGVAMFNNETGAKRLDLLKELVPQMAAVAFLVNPHNPSSKAQKKEAETAANARGVQLSVLEASDEAEIDAALATIGERRDVMMVSSDIYLYQQRDRIAALEAKYAIPAMHTVRAYADAGGLMSYANSNAGTYVPVGNYAGRILKGENPADMPVIRPVKFELVINLKTAATLGLTVPQVLLAQADDIIE